MSTAVSETDYVFLPVDEAVAPRKGGFFQHYVDAWWVVRPEHGLAFYNPVVRGRRRGGRYGAPQCNTDERISRAVGARTVSSLWPDARIEQFPSVWVPVNISDYR